MRRALISIKLRVHACIYRKLCTGCMSCNFVAVPHTQTIKQQNKCIIHLSSPSPSYQFYHLYSARIRALPLLTSSSSCEYALCACELCGIIIIHIRAIPLFLLSYTDLAFIVLRALLCPWCRTGLAFIVFPVAVTIAIVIHPLWPGQFNHALHCTAQSSFSSSPTRLHPSPAQLQPNLFKRRQTCRIFSTAISLAGVVEPSTSQGPAVAR